MICSEITTQQKGTEYKLVLLVDTGSSIGSIATAAARLAEFLSGISFFGFQFDRAILGGWDVTKIEYSSDRIEIFLKEVGSIPIAVLVRTLWPILVWILRFFGIVLLGTEVINLANNVLENQENNAEREQDKQRALCIQTQLNAGKTEAQAIEICKVSYPERDKTDWGSVILLGAGILGIAYVVGSKR